MIRNFFKLDRIIPAILALLLSALIAAAATSGIQRSILPKAFGLHQIDKNIYTDSTAKRTEILEYVRRARITAKDFFGELRSNPRYIICTTQRCKKQFGFKSRGVAYGFEIIAIGPKGVNETIITHEFIHSEVHKRLGYSGLLKQSIPAWFNEGLATYLSKDARLTKTYTNEDIAWIKGAKYRRDWGKYVTKDDWKRAYGSAAQAVRNIDAKIGKKGLRTIIQRVAENGEDIDDVMSELGV